MSYARWDRLERLGKEATIRKTRHHLPKFDKDLHVKATFQFVLKRSCDATRSLSEPDFNVEWDKVQYAFESVETPRDCPICMDHPVAPVLTKCGHIYCLACILNYLVRGVQKWSRCPLCFEPVYLNALKLLKFRIVTPSKIKEKISFVLLYRDKASVNPQMRDNGGPLSSTAMSPHSPFARISIATAKYNPTMEAREALLRELKLEKDVGTREVFRMAMDYIKAAEQEWARDVGVDANSLHVHHHYHLHQQQQQQQQQLASPLSSLRSDVHIPRSLPSAVDAEEFPSLIPLSGILPRADCKAKDAPPPEQQALLLQRNISGGRAAPISSLQPIERVNAATDVGTTAITATTTTATTASTSISSTITTPATTSLQIPFFVPSVPNLRATANEFVPAEHISVLQSAFFDSIEEAKLALNAGGNETEEEKTGGRQTDKMQPALSFDLRTGQLKGLQQEPKTKEESKQPLHASLAHMYHFYQNASGQQVFLHALNYRCLLHEFGSVERLPCTFEAEVLDLDVGVQTPTTQAKMRFLSHLPLTSAYSIAFVDLSPVLSKRTLSAFHEEIKDQTSRIVKERKKRERLAKEELRQKPQQTLMEELYAASLLASNSSPARFLQQKPVSHGIDVFPVLGQPSDKKRNHNDDDNDAVAVISYLSTFQVEGPTRESSNNRTDSPSAASTSSSAESPAALVSPSQGPSLPKWNKLVENGDWAPLGSTSPSASSSSSSSSSSASSSGPPLAIVRTAGVWGSRSLQSAQAAASLEKQAASVKEEGKPPTSAVEPVEVNRRTKRGMILFQL
jgi:hypothetical protein